MKRRIRARPIIHDIRSGMSDGELAGKYNLRPSALQRLFRSLVGAEVISHEELCQRSALYRKMIERKKRRLSPRIGLSIGLPIYDMGSRSFGIVRDISETGLRVAGITSIEGEMKAFQLPIDMLMNADRLLFMAKCLWVTEKGTKQKYSVAGFELMNLLDADLNGLRNFVKFLLLSKSGEWEVTV